MADLINNEFVSVFGLDGKGLQWPSEPFGSLNIQDELIHYSGRQTWEHTNDYAPLLKSDINKSRIPDINKSPSDRDGIIFGSQSGVFVTIFRDPDQPDGIKVDPTSIFRLPVDDHIDNFIVGPGGRLLAAVLDGMAVIWAKDGLHPALDLSEVAQMSPATPQARAAIVKIGCAVLTRGLTAQQRRRYAIPAGPGGGTDASGYPLPPCGTSPLIK